MQTDQIAQEILESPAFRDLLDKHVADSLAAFVELQEKRAGQASLIERIVRVEEAQRSHEALTRVLLEQINLRFEEMQKYMDKRFEQVDKRFEQMDKRFEALTRRLDRFMIWSLGLVASSTALIITILK